MAIAPAEADGGDADPRHCHPCRLRHGESTVRPTARRTGPILRHPRKTGARKMGAATRLKWPRANGCSRPRVHVNQTRVEWAPQPP